jgi:hypothetical protein
MLTPDACGLNSERLSRSLTRHYARRIADSYLFTCAHILTLVLRSSCFTCCESRNPGIADRDECTLTRLSEFIYELPGLSHSVLVVCWADEEFFVSHLHAVGIGARPESGRQGERRSEAGNGPFSWGWEHATGMVAGATLCFTRSCGLNSRFIDFCGGQWVQRDGGWETAVSVALRRLDLRVIP